jgi:alkylation response protein AidB-like acyl-CoA dehydrogenase
MTAYEASSETTLSVQQLDMRTLARDVVRKLALSLAGLANEDPVVAAIRGRESLEELGWTGLLVDEADGGLGLGATERCIVAEEIGRGLLPVPFLSTSVACDVLRLLCRPDLARPRLGRIAEAQERVGVVAGARLLAPALADTGVRAAQAQDGSWSLDGLASLVPEVTGCTTLLVLATAEDSGTGVFEVTAPSPGLTVSPVRTIDLRRDFADVTFSFVAAERLDAEGIDTAALRRAEYLAELTLAAEAVGGALACLEQTITHVTTRHQFGSPIGSFQAIKHRLARAWVSIESSRELVLAAAAAIDDRTAFQEELAISARIAATSALRLAAEEAIQFHGGMGFTWELGVHRYFRRSFVSDQILSTAGGRADRLASTLGV